MICHLFRRSLFLIEYSIRKKKRLHVRDKKKASHRGISPTPKRRKNRHLRWQHLGLSEQESMELYRLYLLYILQRLSILWWLSPISFFYGTASTEDVFGLSCQMLGQLYELDCYWQVIVYVSILVLFNVGFA